MNIRNGNAKNRFNYGKKVLSEISKRKCVFLITVIISLIVFGFNQIKAEKKKQPELEAQMVSILNVEGLQFKDLNKNGALDPYEDWRLPVNRRVEDLLSKMTLKEKAGLMVNESYDLPSKGKIQETGIKDAIQNEKRVDFTVTSPRKYDTSSKQYAKKLNKIQEIAEKERLGIPCSFTNNGEGPGEVVTQIALGATYQPSLVKQVAEIYAERFRAVGIHETNNPQADVSTEPRWTRIGGTYGESPNIVTQMVEKYVNGLQGSSLGQQSAYPHVKHFPGGGPQEDGLDPHGKPGKNMIYPGENLKAHLKPWEAAINAGCRGIMNYYGIVRNLDSVATSFSTPVLQNLLREKLGYDRAITTDWNAVTDRPWGLANKLGYMPSDQDCIREALKVEGGVDQFVCEQISPSIIVDLVKNGPISKDRINISVRRLLNNKFKLGLFEDPYVNPNLVEEHVGIEEHHKVFEKVRRKSAVLLKKGNTLPLEKSSKVFIKSGLNGDGFPDSAQIVNSTEKADVAVVQVSPRKQPSWGSPEEADLRLQEEDLKNVKELINTGTPVVVIIKTSHPVVFPWVKEHASGIMMKFGADSDDIADILFGLYNPQGKLPFELPRSMEVARNQLEDVPCDSKNPLYPCGYGMNYVIGR